MATRITINEVRPVEIQKSGLLNERVGGTVTETAGCHIRGVSPTLIATGTYTALSEKEMRDLMYWLGFDPEEEGVIDAIDKILGITSEDRANIIASQYKPEGE